MFFTKAGTAVAWLCVVGGILHWGYLVSSFPQIGPLNSSNPMWVKHSALAFQDYKLIAFGIVLGIFAEISKSIAARTAPRVVLEKDDPQP